jgi:hypothetical protein
MGALFIALKSLFTMGCDLGIKADQAKSTNSDKPIANTVRLSIKTLRYN